MSSMVVSSYQNTFNEHDGVRIECFAAQLPQETPADAVEVRVIAYEYVEHGNAFCFFEADGLALSFKKDFRIDDHAIKDGGDNVAKRRLTVDSSHPP